MRVLWLVRSNLRTHPGGDTVQILQTAGHLRRLGVEVVLSDALRPQLAGFDLAHLFHLDRLWELVPLCRHLRRRGLPAVLSPIYWPTDAFDRGGRTGPAGWIARHLGCTALASGRLAARWALACLERRRLIGPPTVRFVRLARYVLERVRVVLPNSVAEQRVLEQKFGLCPPAVVVPNGVDLERFTTMQAEPREPDSILCVGRIEPRKNQLRLIEAVRGTAWRLRIVGGAGRFHRGYARRCHQAAGANVEFLGPRRPDELAALYRRARVHACVSWYETPGLASLEAGLCGCALVVTPGGSTREYFGDQAWYCRPDDVASIRAAVQAALSARPAEVLSVRIAERYTWPRAAERTLEAYRRALAT